MNKYDRSPWTPARAREYLANSDDPFHQRCAEAIAKLERERDDLRLMLREDIRCGLVQKDDCAGWWLDPMCGGTFELPDDGTGLPLLTDPARAALEREMKT